MLPVVYILESCIKMKTTLSFYFQSSLRYLKRFYENLRGLRETFWGTTKKFENRNLS